MFYIYGIYSSENNIIRYIGFTSNLYERLKEHHKDLKRKKVNTHKKKWMLKCINNGHKFDYIILDSSESKSIIYELEKYYINNYSLITKLVNGTLGGDGVTMTEEIRKKISVANKGRKMTEENKDNLRILRLGTKLSEETKKKMSDTHKKIGTKIIITDEIRKKYSDRMKGSVVLMTGKKHTQTTIEKIRKAKLGCVSKKMRAVLQIDFKTKNVVNTFESITLATKITGINNIHRCIVGKRKTAGNYEWKYKL